MYVLSQFQWKILGLQRVEIRNKKIDKNIKKHITEKSRAGYYPHCKTLCKTVHDYRTQRIKDPPRFGKKVILVFK